MLAAQNHSAPPVCNLYTLLNYTWIAQAVYVITNLGIPERIAQQPYLIEDLAAECGVRPLPLFQLLRALAGMGIVEILPDGRVGLAANGAGLCVDAPFSIRSYVLLWGEQLYPAGGRMLEQVTTGSTGFQQEFHDPIWTHYAKNPSAQSRFDEFMNDVTKSQAFVITAFYSFKRFKKIVDVGAGRGAMLAAILTKNPHLTGIWCDRPETLPEALEQCRKAGLNDRCEFIAGDFLKSVPEGADLYLIKHVMHDWSDEKASLLLGNVAAAMTDDSTLLIVEAVMNEANGADMLAKCRDLEQMLWTGGRTRSLRDFERILAPHGLTAQRVIHTPIPDVSFVEVTRTSRPPFAHSGQDQKRPVDAAFTEAARSPPMAGRQTGE